MPQSPAQPSTEPAVQDIYHCSKCGYQLIGLAEHAPCPECGSDSRDKLGVAEFLQNDRSRKFWVNLSLVLLQAALVLDITIALARSILLFLGQFGFAAFLAPLSMGFWLIVLALGCYTLFYGITRVNRRGFALFARSVVLYALGFLVTLWGLQQWLIFSDFVGPHTGIGILMSRYMIWIVMLPVSLLVVFATLKGLWMTQKSLSGPIKRSTFISLGALWLTLCLLCLPTYADIYQLWAKSQGAQSPPSMWSSAYPPNRTTYPSPNVGMHLRFGNVSSINPLNRVDPGTGFWLELTSYGIALPYLQNRIVTTANFNPISLHPFAKRDEGLLGLSRIVIFRRAQPFPGLYSVPTPQPPNAYFFLWPEIIWLLISLSLATWFQIWLWLTLRRTRTAFNHALTAA